MGIALWFLIVFLLILTCYFVFRDAQKMNETIEKKIEKGAQPPGVVIEDSFGNIQHDY